MSYGQRNYETVLENLRLESERRVDDRDREVQRALDLLKAAENTIDSLRASLEGLERTSRAQNETIQAYRRLCLELKANVEAHLARCPGAQR